MEIPLYVVDAAGIIADRVESACGIRPLQVTRSEASWIAEFANEGIVKMIAPDFLKVAQLGCKGLIVTAEGDGCDFVSRFFAPKVGINEDPVTGSIHCSLIPYWHRKMGKAKMTARQVSARSGELRCCYAGKRVQIGGAGRSF